MSGKEELKCSNCDRDIPTDSQFCPLCGFPLKGSNAEKRTYNVLSLQVKSWIPEAQKAVNSILSFALIFIMFAVIVTIFSLVFHFNFYFVSLFYFLVALGYALLYYFSKKNPYKAVYLAFLFYALHTIYEFSTGMVIPDFSAGKSGGDIFTLMFRYTPFIYIIFRLMLFFAFIRGIYFILKIEKHPKIAQWLKKGQD